MIETTWQSHLVKALKHGEDIDVLLKSIDEVLLWFAKEYKSSNDILSAKLLREQTPRVIEDKLFKLFDNLLFENQSFGFNELPQDEGALKRRYHRLLQVYHPDKGRYIPKVLHKRTEQINSEYRRLKAQGVVQSKVSVTKKSVNANFNFDSKLDSSHGFDVNSSSLRYSVILGLMLISVLFIASLYFSNRPIHTEPKIPDFYKAEELADIKSDVVSSHLVSKSSKVISNKSARTKLSTDQVESLELFVDLWESAWESQIPSKYLMHYSDYFIPQYMTYEEWLNSRKNALENKSYIKLRISDLKFIPLRKGEVIAKFNQQYFSDSIVDEVKKSLLLKPAEGPIEWEILEENAFR